MGMYLNSIAPYAKYKALASSTYFIDKTALINELNSVLSNSFWEKNV